MYVCFFGLCADACTSTIRWGVGPRSSRPASHPIVDGKMHVQKIFPQLQRRVSCRFRSRNMIKWRIRWLPLAFSTASSIYLQYGLKCHNDCIRGDVSCLVLICHQNSWQQLHFGQQRQLEKEIGQQPPTSLCFSSWRIKVKALLVGPIGSVSKICPRNLEKDSSNPIKKFKTYLQEILKRPST